MDFDKNNQPHFDENNNPYKIIESLRITYVEANSENTGVKHDMIRVQQAFKDGTKPLLPPTEFPLVDHDTLLGIIYAFINLYIYEKRDHPDIKKRKPR